MVRAPAVCGILQFSRADLGTASGFEFALGLLRAYRRISSSIHNIGSPSDLGRGLGPGLAGDRRRPTIASTFLTKASALQHARERPRLPDVSGFSILLVELRRICAMTVPEYFGDRIFTLRYSHDVNMICHLAIGGDSQPKLESIVAEQFPVPKMVGFIEKHTAAAHATLSNMMRKSWTDNPSHSRHKHHNDDLRRDSSLRKAKGGDYCGSKAKGSARYFNRTLVQ